MESIVLRSFKKVHVIGMFVLAVALLVAPVPMSGVGNVKDERVVKSMAALKELDDEIRSAKYLWK